MKIKIILKDGNEYEIKTIASKNEKDISNIINILNSGNFIHFHTGCEPDICINTSEIRILRFID